jgi:cytochrome oxidase Cu insertion factor (SCO1/SenC/PrrC family)
MEIDNVIRRSKRRKQMTIKHSDVYSSDVKLMDKDKSVYLIKHEGSLYVARPRGKMRDWEVLYQIN